MTKKNKYEKPIEVNMGFDEMMKRLSKVEKSKVEANINRDKKKKD
tara:strand:- start:4368 stop:4502 length:135 start_codon:yes stop_codon:yes gene_type:complete